MPAQQRSTQGPKRATKTRSPAPKWQRAAVWLVLYALLLLGLVDCGAYKATNEPQVEPQIEVSITREPQTEPEVTEPTDASEQSTDATKEDQEKHPDTQTTPEPGERCLFAMYRECRLSGVGDCGSGTQMCSEQGHWSQCIHNKNKTAEICDGRDNDCDGEIDEDFSKSNCCVPTKLLTHTKPPEWLPLKYPPTSLSPDGAELALIHTETFKLMFIDAKSGQRLREYPDKKWGSNGWDLPPLRYHPKKHWLAVGGYGAEETQTAIYLFDAKAATLVRQFKGRAISPTNPEKNRIKSETRHIFFSPDGSLLTAVYGDTGDYRLTARRRIVVWNTEDGSIHQTVDANDSMILSVGFSHDNALMATGSALDQIKLWRLSDGKLLHTVRGMTHPAALTTPKDIYLDFHPKRPHLLVSSSNGEFRVWDTQSGTLLKQFKYPGSPQYLRENDTREGPYHVKYDPSGRWLLLVPSLVRSVQSKGLYLLNATDYKILHTFGYDTSPHTYKEIQWGHKSQSFYLINFLDIWRFGCTR